MVPPENTISLSLDPFSSTKIKGNEMILLKHIFHVISGFWCLKVSQRARVFRNQKGIFTTLKNTNTVSQPFVKIDKTESTRSLYTDTVYMSVSQNDALSLFSLHFMTKWCTTFINSTGFTICLKVMANHQNHKKCLFVPPAKNRLINCMYFPFICFAMGQI